MSDSTDRAYVRFAEVQKSYDGEELVIKNLNLDIDRGEFLTMLGPSGSGKTTCLMMLAGFLTASICFMGDIQSATFSAFSSRAWGSTFFLALGPSIFAYTCWYRLIKVVPVN